MKFDSDKILAAGVPVTLADGQEVRIHYTLRSMKLIEDRYGSIDAFARAASAMDAPEGETPQGKVFETISTLIYAGLLHLRASEDDILDALDPSKLMEYVEASMTAFTRSMPEQPEGEAQGEPQTNGSPGPTSTTSPQSVSAVQTVSSGV